jgi:outer membrane protein OmpA-like peptidoglycan-associated protein
MTITLDSMSAGNSFVLKNIFFDFDKAILRPDSRFELERLVSLLTHYRSLTALIGGYTDSTGTPQHNEELSQARAQAVVDYLVSAGIDSGRIKAFGYGASDPVAPNATEEGKQLNRRVVFRVVGTKNE